MPGLCGLALFLLLAGAGCRTATEASHPTEFAFIAAGDMRNFSGPSRKGNRYFDGACEELQKIGPGEFMVGPGDVDPPGLVRAMIDRYLGTNYLWYPIVGNHETEKKENMTWLKRWASNGIPHLVRRGPLGAELTTYSFDFANSHVIMLNEYYDGKSDDVRGQDLPESTMRWLAEDLAANRQPLVFVVGHKPIQSIPDMDSGRVRHEKESVSTNSARLDQFLTLLRENRVRAYICGHTHNASVTKIKGIWQIDSGHARGAGDSGSPSTFIKIRVSGTRVQADIYRADPHGENYRSGKPVELD